MVKVPSGRLTWEESLDIRKAALAQSAQYCGRRDLPASSVVMMAQEFEKYLKGETNG